MSLMIHIVGKTQWYRWIRKPDVATISIVPKVSRICSKRTYRL